MATLQHTDELYHILEDEICALKILPGEALSENQLCKRFGVSRTPIRSVLQRLEQNRFVQIIPCKGTIVTAIDTGVVDQLIFQRVAVEGMVFRDFVQSCSPMEILAVEHLYNMLLEAAAGRSDPENFDFNHFLSCDLAMHEYWFHKTSKEYLWEQMTRPQADYSRFIRLDIVGARNVSSVVSEHAEMLRILREEDLDAIVEAGLYAPSAKNLQSTKLVVVRDAAVLARLERLNSRILGTPEGTPFYGAPEAIVVLSDSEYPNWLQDGSLVMGNLMNAAAALGIGSCWINRAMETFELPEGKALLAEWGLGENWKGVGNCILGYTDQAVLGDKARKEDRVLYV